MVGCVKISLTNFAELPESYHKAEEREALEKEAFEEFRRRSSSTRLKKKPVLFSDVQAASLAEDMKRVQERQREIIRQRALKVQTEREELILKQRQANEEMIRRKNIIIEKHRKSMQQSIIMQTNSSRQQTTTGIPIPNAPTTVQLRHHLRRTKPSPLRCGAPIANRGKCQEKTARRGNMIAFLPRDLGIVCPVTTTTSATRFLSSCWQELFDCAPQTAVLY